MQPDGAPVRPLLPRYVLVLIRVELVHQLHRVRHVLPAESGRSRISRGQGKAALGSGGTGGGEAAAGARRCGRNGRQL